MTLLAPYYDGSYDGIGFWEQTTSDGTFQSAGDTAGDSTVYKDDVGNSVVIYRGLAPRIVEVQIAVDQAELDNLRAAINHQADLVWHEGTTPNVILLSVVGAKKDGDFESSKAALRVLIP